MTAPNRHQLAFYQDMILLKPYTGIYTGLIDTRKQCLLCDKRRLTGHVTNKGFLCYLCQEKIKQTAKRKQISFVFIKQKQTLPVTTEVIKKEPRFIPAKTTEYKEYKELFKQEVFSLLKSVEIPPTLLLVEINKRLQKKGIYAPSHVVLCNLVSGLRREGYAIPKQSEIMGMWRNWVRNKIRENISWDNIISSLQKGNNWTRLSAIEFVRPLAKELGKKESFSLYLNRRTVKKQNRDQLELLVS